MTRTYISYALTLLSGLLVYFMFAAASSVAAGITWIPAASFVGSILHIGISSWLFLAFPKPGKITSFITTTLICFWPITACIGSMRIFDFEALIFYTLPLIISGFVIWNHLKSFQDKEKKSTKTQIVLSALPLAFLIYMFCFYYALFTQA
ncbi:hypothetical protein [Hymenobacter actinosclerus]|uniref:hypothetical protein n=1 Tax=Hymenobacter actinosclerus TaxID=82805 RepID=UPI0011609F10|nr:hypothetical protein [Hymenobacter actinosclerus]